MSILMAVLLVAVAGCSSRTPTVTSSGLPSSAVPSAVDAPSAAARCGAPQTPSTPARVISADGAELAAFVTGAGTRGVLLIPELGRQNLCGWWEYAGLLAGRGQRVLLFDHQCAGQSGCPPNRPANASMQDIEAAVAALRDDGADRIVLMGASQGAAEAVIAGAQPPVGVVGVVAVSADELQNPLAEAPYPRSAAEAAPRLALPSLFAVAPNDPYVSVAETQRLVGSVPAGATRLVVLASGSGHGWDLVRMASNGIRPGQPNSEILTFLDEVMP